MAILPTYRPVELSFPVPRHLHLTLQAHLTFLGNCSMIHLTTSTIGEGSSTHPPLGSFVYAMPDRLDAQNAISTALSTEGSSIDYATRLSKILARRFNHPVYVGCSMSFAGLTAEEEMEGIAAVVGKILEAADKNKVETSKAS
ncbi:uncharacterized protein HMPREF1541_00928 [Cyphellophora europaea CBS 101466]|uniref:Proteasome assembly chaperone 3 n=1 Tax=Cyphellophora europaea (strain CBS 101466) TaxID=1220924 RepID=W2SFR1_CYPE1|nr:uncharacterized protein HMPREF1541_00928 [Cyphellophora europaea CBS 101466]ETN46739.1 hypothetical protein HMPREF1541_00928 [Cyphellophora europaea CBS 101466]